VLTTLFSPTGFPFKVVQLDDTLADEAVYTARLRSAILASAATCLGKPAEDGTRRLFQRCPAAPWMILSASAVCRSTPPAGVACQRSLGLVWPGQAGLQNGEQMEERLVVTLGNHLDASGGSHATARPLLGP